MVMKIIRIYRELADPGPQPTSAAGKPVKFESGLTSLPPRVDPTRSLEVSFFEP